MDVCEVDDAVALGNKDIKSEVMNFMFDPGKRRQLSEASMLEKMARMRLHSLNGEQDSDEELMKGFKEAAEILGFAAKEAELQQAMDKAWAGLLEGEQLDAALAIEDQSDDDLLKDDEPPLAILDAPTTTTSLGDDPASPAPAGASPAGQNPDEALSPGESMLDSDDSFYLGDVAN